MKEISAGGIVYKKEKGQIKLLLIEDLYKKITIPKGKQEHGETLEQTAIREISEETGIQGEIRRPLDKVQYTYSHPVHGQINKEVTYFLVEVIGGNIEVQIEEINKVYWRGLNEALQLQKEKGYDNNDSIFALAQQSLTTNR
jgi:8-oxo-dGTP pyrophosphatase MutT (NUDIX family)